MGYDLVKAKEYWARDGSCCSHALIKNVSANTKRSRFQQASAETPSREGVNTNGRLSSSVDGYIQIFSET